MIAYALLGVVAAILIVAGIFFVLLRTGALNSYVKEQFVAKLNEMGVAVTMKE